MLMYHSFRLYLSLLQSHLPAYPSNLYITMFIVYTYDFKSIQRYRGNLLQLAPQGLVGSAVVCANSWHIPQHAPSASIVVTKRRCVQARRPDPLQLAPKLKSAPLPSKQQLSLTAEASVPADMISAYVPQREQQQSNNTPAAGRDCVDKYGMPARRMSKTSRHHQWPRHVLASPYQLLPAKY